MEVTKPKVLPTLICLAVIGLFAATLPYPGLSSNLSSLEAAK